MHFPSCHPLGEQISELAAQLNAATCQLLELIARFDAERGWAKDGCFSCAHWLNWKSGIGLVAAREKACSHSPCACHRKMAPALR